jgi:MFS family permease
MVGSCSPPAAFGRSPTVFSVVLGLYLDAIGLTATSIGWIFTAALAGGAAMTIVITAVADRLGRKRLLILGAVLMAVAGSVFALSHNLFLLVLAAIFGTVSPSGKEVGPFLSIEQAILPETTEDQQRTSAFAAYNLVGSLFGALGALAVALPSLFSIIYDLWIFAVFRKVKPPEEQH